MQQTIRVDLVPDFRSARNVEAGCAVVIDVLRATSVMVTACHHGATRIWTCGEVDAARHLAAAAQPTRLLCGERHCRPIEGFTLGNSPSEYGPSVVGGRELVLTTTNGTRAIESVASARRLVVASFLNLSATVQTLIAEPNVHVVCAGTDGEVSYEDVLLAGAITARLRQHRADARIDDSARIAQSAWQAVLDHGVSSAGGLHSTEALAGALQQSLGGRNLIRAGYQQDILRCAQLDAFGQVVERGPDPVGGFVLSADSAR
ncbi:2-phosphosulfolactate phosphatase [Roseiconus nitratireducens]|nr:2-phosphosulfolactate phosphatase [Roseiconus nitratireducens]